MKWQKPSAELLETFEHILPKASSVEKRKMFGYPTGYVDGNWFMGCFGENDIVLRLSEEDRQKFLTLDEARQFEPMPGRVMREFVVIPSWMLNDPTNLQEWINKSMQYASTLLRQEKKKRRT